MFPNCRAWGRMSLSSAFGAALPRRFCTYGLMKAARLGGGGNDSQFTCSICSLPCAVMLHRWQRLSCLQVRRSKYPFRSSEAITFEAFERVSPISLAICEHTQQHEFVDVHAECGFQCSFKFHYCAKDVVHLVYAVVVHTSFVCFLTSKEFLLSFVRVRLWGAHLPTWLACLPLVRTAAMVWNVC